MTHTALARTYRPRKFADLVAQDHVAQAILGAVARDRVAHAYLFAGPRGVGKTTAARVLAMTLNCAGRGGDGEPCGSCDSCTRIWQGAANLDVVEIDAASNRGVEDARGLRERAMYAPSAEGRTKVYIVDEAHMLTREAWNALLKILEEPPPSVVFVFATTEPQKIAQSAAPVLSRVQRFDFRRIGPEAVADRLREVVAAEGIEAEPEALHLIARHADGGMRDALSILDQVVAFGVGRVGAGQVREALGLVPDELFIELLQLIITRRPAEVFGLTERVIDAGGDLVEFVQGAGEVLRTVLLAQHDASLPPLGDALGRAVKEAAASLGPGDVVRMLDLLVESEQALRRGPSRLALETLLLKWTVLERVVSVTEVLEALHLGQGENPPPSRARTPEPANRAPARAPAAPPGGSTPPSGDGLSLERLRSLWPQVLSMVARKNRFLGEAVSSTVLLAVTPPEVLLEVPEDEQLAAEGVERGRAQLEEVIQTLVDAPVEVRVRRRGSEAVEGAAAPAGRRAPRLTEAEARAERLRSLRTKDPVLDQAADALDLELID